MPKLKSAKTLGAFFFLNSFTKSAKSLAFQSQTRKAISRGISCKGTRSALLKKTEHAILFFFLNKKMEYRVINVEYYYGKNKLVTIFN